MTDPLWSRLRSLVDDAFEDQGVLTDPPTNELEWSHFGDTLVDHLCAEVHAALGGVLPSPLTQPWTRWRPWVRKQDRSP